MTNLDDDTEGVWEQATVVRSPEARLFTKRRILAARLRQYALSPLDREIRRQRLLYLRQKAREGR